MPQRATFPAPAKARTLAHMAMLILSLMLTVMVFSSVIGVRMLIYRADAKARQHAKAGEPSAEC